MIAIDEIENLLRINVFGELTLADFREFEDAVTDELKNYPRVNLLLDLSQMSGFTLDAALEDIQFNRQHVRDFNRIAVVTDSQWLAWLTWLSGVFSEADVQTFPERSDAESWLGS
jgi:hypothetical protein